jgi:hypothetical protein
MQFASRAATSRTERAVWSALNLVYALTFGLLAVVLVGVLYLACGCTCLCARPTSGNTRASVFLTLASVVASMLFTGTAMLLVTPLVLPLSIWMTLVSCVRAHFARRRGGAAADASAPSAASEADASAHAPSAASELPDDDGPTPVAPAPVAAAEAIAVVVVVSPTDDPL